MIMRPRRLRQSEPIRKMARETKASPSSLVLPLFVKEGCNIREEIPSLPGQIRYSPDTLTDGVEKALRQGVHNFLLFGLPAIKDETGSEAYSETGVIQQALHQVRKNIRQEALLITDVCLCEYTNHGHCGAIRQGGVDNDETLPLLAQTALSHVQAGSDIVAPSDMMDGRVQAIRNALEQNGYPQIPIMSYAVKYASSFYGPFRDAAGSAPQFGDRKSYQMDYHNQKEALKEARLDEKEGADFLIVKPALSYLDIVQAVSRQTHLPVVAYSVSGEYAMIKSAAQKGLIDEYALMCETAVSIFRSGASILISYYAVELAKAIEKGDIG